MNRFRKSMGVSLIFTLFIMCFYFPFSVFAALIQHENMLQVLVNCALVSVFLFGIIAFSMNEFYRFIDERNRIEAEERARRDKAAPEDRTKLPPPPAGPDAPQEHDLETPPKE